MLGSAEQLDSWQVITMVISPFVLYNDNIQVFSTDNIMEEFLSKKKTYVKQFMLFLEFSDGKKSHEYEI